MCFAALAAAAPAISTGLQIAGLAASVFGSYQQAKATKDAYTYQAKVNENNAKVAEWMAQDALARGQKEEQQQRLKAAALKSTQRAAFAARGVSLDEGSPLSILQDTDYMNEMDVLTIRDNAAREAWAYRNQGANYSSESALMSAKAAATNPLFSATSTLLTGGAQVASSWYRRKATTTG